MCKTIFFRCCLGATLLWLVLLSTHLSAQMAMGLNKDSLRHVVERAKPDTAKVQQLFYLGQQYENNQPDSAVYFYQEAGQLSRTLHYPAGFIRYVSNYTAVLNLRGQFQESLQLNLQAIDTCERYKLDALNFTRAYVNTGNVYEYIGDYASASAYYLKALPLVEAHGDPQGLSTVYNNLSGFYRNLHQPAKAVDYATRALDFAKKAHDLYSEGLASINLGNALKDMNQTATAIPYINSAYAIARQLPDSALMETALIDIGDLYLRENRPVAYIPVYRKALVLAGAVGDVSGQAYAMQGVAYGLFWTGRYHDAETLLAVAIPFAQKNQIKEVWRDLLLLMSDLQAIGKNMDAYRRYRALSDSVGNTIVNQALLKNEQELETRYEVEKTQHDLLKKDVLLAEKDKAGLRQRAWLIAAFSGAIVLALLFVLTWINSRQRQHLQRRTIQALEAEQENIRLRSVLEGQLAERTRISQEMHDDMGSGLTSLVFLSRGLTGAGSEAAQKINEVAGQLIRKMNEIIWTLNHEQDSLDSLIAYIRTNTAQLLEYAGFDYHFEIPKTLPDLPVSPEFRRNVYLVAKEAVHNAVRHSGGTSMDIEIKTDNNTLTITLKDNGKGFDPSALGRFGNGQRNMKDRIVRVGGRLSIGADRGTNITIEVPLH